MGSDNMCKNPFVENEFGQKYENIHLLKWVRTKCMKNTFLENGFGQNI